MTKRSNPPAEVSSFGFPALDPRDTPTLSLLGHDLRATLSEVIGGLRLVEEATLDSSNLHKIARTLIASEALSLLLEQALSIMLGEADQDSANQGPLQTQRLLDSIRLRWEGRARDNGLSFHLDASGLPPRVQADGALIERVLSNLLGNAMKFAGSGCVTCRIGLVDGHMSISVVDQGPGFPENALPRLFQVNSRPENASKPGSGLGLHIVRDMVDRAGGTIVARNLPEGGAEVVVGFPLPDQTGAAHHTTSSVFPDLSRCRILVVDDNETNRLLLSQFLLQMGAEVIISADGVAAIGRLEREHFDLLLIDIEMPQMNGLDVIRHLRAMPGSMARLPVLAVTAHISATKRLEITQAGADAILAKPVVCPVILGEAVSKTLGMRPIAPPSAAQDRPDIDLAQFERLLVMAGPDTAAELVTRFLEDLRQTERMLLLAEAGPDWAAIRAQTHVLIALAGTAGAHRLQSLSENLNQTAQSGAADWATVQPLFAQTLLALAEMITSITGMSNPVKSAE